MPQKPAVKPLFKSLADLMISLAILGTIPVQGFCTDYYVSPSGDDTHPGSISLPFRTLNQAVTIAQAGDTVYLRSGVYRETLAPVHSGTSVAPILFSGYPGENAVLCGTDVVKGSWTVYHGNIYQAKKVAPTWAVFVDGRMMREARWPQTPIDNYFSGYATTGTGTTQTKVMDPNLPDLNLNDARVHITPGSAWVSYTRGIVSYGDGSFGFDKPVGTGPAYYPKPGNLYYLYGSLALLGAEGEWFQDPSGTLYLWVPGGDSPTNHLVEIAARKRVMDDEGQSHIRLQNLFTFGGGIFFNNCTGCEVDRVHQKYVQHYSEVEGFNAEADQNGFINSSGCTWSNGSIVYSAGNGVFISGTNDTVSNMNISEVDYIGTYRGNIQCEGSGHQILLNTLFDSGRYCVFHDQTKGGFIRYNEMYNAGLLTKDVGTTYSWHVDGEGLEIAYNFVHDVHSTLGMGIYLDDLDSNYLVHHNVVRDCTFSGIILHDVARHNNVFNNTVADCQYWVNYTANSLYIGSMNGTSIINNLGAGAGTFYYPGGETSAVIASNGTYPPSTFVSGGYQLSDGSGAIDKGLIVPGITDGYLGKAPDIGAYEYGRPVWSAGSSVTAPSFPYP